MRMLVQMFYFEKVGITQGNRISTFMSLRGGR
jgi:hypothetical protein